MGILRPRQVLLGDAEKSQIHPSKQIVPSHPVTTPEATLSPAKIHPPNKRTAAFDQGLGFH
jgi:hypothetical protein